MCSICSKELDRERYKCEYIDDPVLECIAHFPLAAYPQAPHVNNSIFVERTTGKPIRLPHAARSILGRCDY